MGTNFYWKTDYEPPPAQTILLPTGEEYGVEPIRVDKMNPIIHIGKRSAAGLYCWDCKTSLIKTGRVHYDSTWHEACPLCKKVPVKEKLEESTMGQELGFGKQIAKPSGVRSCCSFSWAQEPEVVRRICRENMEKDIIENEYLDHYTGRLFLEQIDELCPIQSTVSIGRYFC